MNGRFDAFIDQSSLANNTEIEATLAEWHGRRRFKALVLIFPNDSVTLERYDNAHKRNLIVSLIK